MEFLPRERREEIAEAAARRRRGFRREREADLWRRSQGREREESVVLGSRRQAVQMGEAGRVGRPRFVYPVNWMGGWAIQEQATSIVIFLHLGPCDKRELFPFWVIHVYLKFMIKRNNGRERLVLI
jgi:hypothetical protein